MALITEEKNELFSRVLTTEVTFALGK